MKKELIKTDNYLLIVDDSEIKVGNWVYNQVSKEMYRFNENLVNYEKKVIAHLPINDSADLKGVQLLPPLPNGEDDVEELAEKIYPFYMGYVYEEDVFFKERESYKRGCNETKSKYKFSENDVKKAIEMSRDIKYITYSLDEIIQSLSQPKTPTHFEYEMQEYVRDMPNIHSKYYLPKTTTNSQGQQVACGKYIYEI